MVACLVYPVVLTFAILFAVVFIATWNELNALDPILSPKMLKPYPSPPDYLSPVTISSVISLITVI